LLFMTLIERSILVAESQSLHDASISLNVLALQILQQTASLPDQFQQTSPRMVILGVDFEVLGEIVDALTEQGDLDLR